MKRLPVITLLLLGYLAPSHADSTLEVVKALTRAFNEHDVEAMLDLVTDDVTWLSLQGDSVSVETRGKEALGEGMTGYFKSLPSVRSTLESSMVSGRYVAVHERASWTDGKGEPQSQTATAVYEVRGGRVARVWYYPAE